MLSARFPVVLTKYLLHLSKLPIIPMIPVAIICKKSASKSLKRFNKEGVGKNMTDFRNRSLEWKTTVLESNRMKFSPNVLKLKIAILKSLRLNFDDVHPTRLCLIRGGEWFFKNSGSRSLVFWAVMCVSQSRFLYEGVSESRSRFFAMFKGLEVPIRWFVFF